MLVTACPRHVAGEKQELEAWNPLINTTSVPETPWDKEQRTTGASEPSERGLEPPKEGLGTQEAAWSLEIFSWSLEMKHWDLKRRLCELNLSFWSPETRV